jgi:CRP/FNR family transcriptional regulator
MEISLIDSLKAHDIFSELSSQDLKSIASITQNQPFQKDQVVFYEGDLPNYFYLLHSGCAKVYKVDPKGNEIVLHNFIAPTLVAEMASIENIKFPASCVALEESSFLLIKKEEFVSLLQQDPNISFHIIRSLTKKIKGVESLLNRSLIFDATTKVAHYLYNFPNALQEKKNRIIATELHITPETLSRVVKKLKNLKILNEKRELIDKEKLEMFLEFY